MGKKTAYLKNAAKSIGTASLDAAGDLMPNLKKSVNDNKAYVKNIYKKLKSDQRESDVRKSYLYRSTKQIVDNAIKDLQSGNFNNKDRANKLSQDAFNKAFNFDFDDEDMNFDSYSFTDEATDKSGKGKNNIDATVNNASFKIDSNMDEESKFNIKQITNLNASLLRINNIGFNTLNTQMKSIIEFHNFNTLNFYNNIDEKIASMDKNLNMLGAYLTDISNNNSNIKGSLAKDNSNRKTLQDAFGMTGISIPEWLELYGLNKKENSSGLSLLIDTLIKPEIAKIKGNPLGYILKTGIKAAIPKNIKNSMKDFDNLIGLMPLLMQGKFSQWKKQGGIKGILGNFLSLDKFKAKSSSYNYQKGPISWNGIGQRAITHVIPGYLSKILVGINKLAGINQKQMFYDYDNGKFTDKDSAVKTFREKIKDSSKVSGSGSKELKNDVLNELKKQGKIKNDKDAEKYNSQIEDAFSNMAKNGTLFNDINNLGDITGWTYKIVKNPDTGKNEKIKVPKNPKLAKMILDNYKKMSNRNKMKMNEDLGNTFRNYQQKINELNEDDLYQQTYDYRQSHYKQNKKIFKVEDIFKKADTIINDKNIESKIKNEKLKKIFEKGRNIYNTKRANKDNRNKYGNTIMEEMYKFFLDPEEFNNEYTDPSGRTDYRKIFESINDFIKDSVKEIGGSSKDKISKLFNTVKSKFGKRNNNPNITPIIEGFSTFSEDNPIYKVFSKLFNKRNNNKEKNSENSNKSNNESVDNKTKRKNISVSEKNNQTMTDVSILSTISNFSENSSSNSKSVFKQILKNRKSKNPINISSRLMSLFNNTAKSSRNNKNDLTSEFTKIDGSGKNAVELIKGGMKQISDKKLMLGTAENPMIVKAVGGYLDKIKDVDDVDVPGANTAAGQRNKAEEEKKYNQLLSKLTGGGNGENSIGDVSKLTDVISKLGSNSGGGLFNEIVSEVIGNAFWKLPIISTIGKGIVNGGKWLFGGAKSIGKGIFSGGKKAVSWVSNLFKGGKGVEAVAEGAKGADLASDGANAVGKSGKLAKLFSKEGKIAAGLGKAKNWVTNIFKGADLASDGANAVGKSGKLAKLFSKEGKIASGLGKAKGFLGGLFKGSKGADAVSGVSKVLGSTDDVARVASGASGISTIAKGADLAVDGANAVGKVGKFSKILSGGGKIVSGLGKAGRVLGKVALPLQILSSGIDAFKGWNNASDYYGDDPTFGQKFTSATANVLSGLTFGLIKQNLILDGMEKTKKFGKKMMDKVKGFFGFGGKKKKKKKKKKENKNKKDNSKKNSKDELENAIADVEDSEAALKNTVEDNKETEAELKSTTSDIEKEDKNSEDKSKSGRGKILSGLGKIGKIIGKAVLPLQIFSKGFDAFKGWKNANKYYGDDPTFGQKATSAMASVISSLTFGLVKQDSVVKGLEKIKDLFGFGKKKKDKNSKDATNTENSEAKNQYNEKKEEAKLKKKEEKESKDKETTKSNPFATQGDDNEESSLSYATNSDLQKTDMGRIYLRKLHDDNLENGELLSGVKEPYTARGHEISAAYHVGKYLRGKTFSGIFGSKGLFYLTYKTMKSNGGVKKCILKLLGLKGSGKDDDKAKASGGSTTASKYWDEVFNFVGEEESNNDPGQITDLDWDAGGKSYGTYQFSLDQGSLKEFVDFLGRQTNDAKAQDYYKRLSSVGLGSTEFDSVWKQIASEDPKGFQDLQQKRMIEGAYEPAIKQIQKIAPDFDPSKYTVALNSLIMSTATQFGPGGKNKNGSVWKYVFGNSENLKDETKMIQAFKEARIQYFPTTRSRYEREYDKAMALYEKYKGTTFGDGNGSTGSEQATGKTAEVVKNMEALVNAGYPYVWGGDDPSDGGFDCSGSIQYAYKQAGINIPRTTYEQIAQLTPVPVEGDMGIKNAQPGDLIFPHDGHVYMYEGDGYILEAPYTGANLRRVKNTRQAQYIRRVITSQGDAGGAVSNSSYYNKLMSGQTSEGTGSYGVTTEQFNRMRNTDKNNLMVQLREVMSTVASNTSQSNEILSKILEAINTLKTGNSAVSNNDSFSLTNELISIYNGY